MSQHLESAMVSLPLRTSLKDNIFWRQAVGYLEGNRAGQSKGFTIREKEIKTMHCTNEQKKQL